MAAYSFETMSASDAASFTASDYLIFITKGSTANQVTVAPYSNGSSGSLNGSGIDVSFGGKTLTFPNDVSSASLAGHVLFQDNSHLQIGTQAGDATFVPVGSMGGTGTTTAGMAVDPQTVYALGGGDMLNFTTEAASRSDYLNGGFGADTILGGNANSHIYGNSMLSKPGDTDSSGTVDGGDSITAGNGSNYINGNAGADTITAGTAATGTGTTATPGSSGFNRIFGGADNDTINIMGNGHNAVNGNTGNDTIADTGMGDNTLRGGQGNDLITGGSGHSVLMGDVGNDTIVIHAAEGTTTTGSGVNHIDVITGGDGSDLFNFSAAGSATAATFGQVTYYQEITDYTQGTDHLEIATAVTAGQVGHSSTVFSSVHDAELYAQTQLSGTGGVNNSYTVSSLAVGSTSNTFLFYSDTAAMDPSTNGVQGLGIIHLDNVVASTISYTDFVGGTTAATMVG